MKINSNNLRKAQIVMDCVMIALFGILFVKFLTQGEYTEAAYNLLLMLAWLAILLKDRENARYVKRIDLYEELVKKMDEYINILIGVINEKQKNNDTDTCK